MPTDDRLYLVGFKAENIMGLTAVSLEFSAKGGLVEVTGPNEGGKSSLLSAIETAFRGAVKDIQEPLRKGASQGVEVATLVDSKGRKFTVTRAFTPKTGPGGRLKVEGEAGKFGSPQDLLDSLYEVTSLDPERIFSLPKQEQFEQVFRLVPEDKIRAELERLGVTVGLDETPAAALLRIRQEAYEYRREQNRFADESTKRATGIMLPTEAKTAERVSVAELQAERKQLEEERETRNALGRAVENAQSKTAAVVERYNQAEEQVAQLESKLAQARSQLSTLADAVRRGNDEIAHAETEYGVSTDVAPIIAQLDSQIADADRVNQLVTLRETKVQHEADAKQHAAEAKKSDDQINEIDGFTRQAVAAYVPVEGLEVDLASRELRYKGLPLVQVKHNNGTEALDIALAIAMAHNPKLRTILIRRGSEFGTKKMARLRELAVKHDYRIFVERVDESGKVGIYIEDGTVKAIDGKEAT